MPKTVIINVRPKKVIKGNKSSKSTVAKKGSKSGGLFSGKVLGFQVPILSGVLKNKTAQKVLVGAGLVSVALNVAQFLNNAQLNKVLAKKEARILLAAAGGDIPGAAFQFFKEGGIKSINLSGSGSTQQVMQSKEGFA